MNIWMNNWMNEWTAPLRSSPLIYSQRAVPSHAQSLLFTCYRYARLTLSTPAPSRVIPNITPMGDFWKHFDTHFENIQFENHWNLWGILKTLWNTLFENIVWKPLKHMGNFENTLKDIIWKPLKPMVNFENTLKNAIWKSLKPMGDFWKHFETHFENIQFENHWNLWGILKTLWNIIWKHSETHNLKTIETYGDF